MTRRALYIGRFQVFHLGHVDVLQQIGAAEDVDAILMAIGSSQYDHTKRSPVAPWSHNPFTLEERQEMIERSLAGLLAKPWSMHPVPDLHDWPKWFDFIANELPRFTVLYSADPKEREFFAERGYETRDFERRFSFHAGWVRDRLARGLDDYREALPAGTLDVLDRIDAAARMADLYQRDAERSQRPGGPG